MNIIKPFIVIMTCLVIICHGQFDNIGGAGGNNNRNNNRNNDRNNNRDNDNSNNNRNRPSSSSSSSSLPTLQNPLGPLGNTNRNNNPNNNDSNNNRNRNNDNSSNNNGNNRNRPSSSSSSSLPTLQNPLGPLGNPNNNNNNQKIMDMIEKNVNQISQFLTSTKLKMNETFSKLFPTLSKLNASKIKECYDSSLEQDDYNFFDQNLQSTIRVYYNNYPENFDIKTFPRRIKNIFESMIFIANYTIQCAANLSEYQLGLTSLSDWDDAEYRMLLGEKHGNTVDNEYNNRKQGRRPNNSNNNPLNSLNPFRNRNRRDINIDNYRRTKRAIEVADECKAKKTEKLPKKFDWRDKGIVTGPKFQGKCGSCWAFVSTSILESQYLLQGLTRNKTIDLSEQELIDCAKQSGCKGATAIDAYNYMLTNEGITDENSYPYESKDGQCKENKKTNIVAEIDDYCVRGKYVTMNGKQEQLTDEDIQYIIKEFGPVYSTMNADDLGSMKNLKKGIYKNKRCDKKTNHAITIIGWDNHSWLVKNSWGTKWADKGFFRMKRGENLCGINTYIVYPLLAAKN